MWTMQNTEGYTQDELDTINEAIERLQSVVSTDDIDDEQNFNDAIANSWCEGMTADELVEAIYTRWPSLRASA